MGWLSNVGCASLWELVSVAVCVVSVCGVPYLFVDEVYAASTLRGAAWLAYLLLRVTPEPYSNGYFASLVAMARHWYKLADHSVTYMVERGRSAPPVSTVTHGFAPSLPSYICDI